VPQRLEKPVLNYTQKRDVEMSVGKNAEQVLRECREELRSSSGGDWGLEGQTLKLPGKRQGSSWRGKSVWACREALRGEKKKEGQE